MQVVVSDFDGDFKAYGIKINDDGPGYVDRRMSTLASADPRDIDILDSEVWLLDTKEVANLYGDLMRDKILSGRKGRPIIEQVDLKLVTITLTFNELNKMAAKISAAHNGHKLSDIPNTDDDPISQIFRDTAQEHELGHDLQTFFVTTSKQLKAVAQTAKEAREYPTIEKGMGDGCMEEPVAYAGGYSHAGAILNDMFAIAGFNQIDWPAYSDGNKYVICGVFAAGAQDLKAKDLPLPDQNRPVSEIVIDEAARALKIK